MSEKQCATNALGVAGGVTGMAFTGGCTFCLFVLAMIIASTTENKYFFILPLYCLLGFIYSAYQYYSSKSEFTKLNCIK